MTDTAKNSAAAEEGVYETPEDIAAEAAKTAERAARRRRRQPHRPRGSLRPARWVGSFPGPRPARATCSRLTRRWRYSWNGWTPAAWSCGPTRRTRSWTWPVGELGDSGHAHGSGQVHGGLGALLHGRGHGAHCLLHRPHQGARVREVLRHGGHPRPRERGHDHGGLHHQHRGAGHLLHGGDPREPGPARRARVEGWPAW